MGCFLGDKNGTVIALNAPVKGERRNGGKATLTTAQNAGVFFLQVNIIGVRFPIVAILLLIYPRIRSYFPLKWSRKDCLSADSAYMPMELSADAKAYCMVVFRVTEPHNTAQYPEITRGVIAAAIACKPRISWCQAASRAP